MAGIFAFGNRRKAAAQLHVAGGIVNGAGVVTLEDLHVLRRNGDAVCRN